MRLAARWLITCAAGHRPRWWRSGSKAVERTQATLSFTGRCTSTQTGTLTSAVTAAINYLSGTYAYVYPTQPYKIYVCGAFWNAPMTGTDSKGGTLVHEMMHFNVVAASDDWAYGQTASKSMAISNPTKALDNSDSHEYFAENTPFQN
ncbi:MAG: M35 family metallo-endopeptidase [Ideonella sp.]|nr:M35 family metallo-endopeptidase [Ideonella sp.]